jgi:hypothetical protein
MNGNWWAVIDSYISNFHDANTDSQAIIAWGGDGPFKIVNNYLEGASENLNFGGVTPVIVGLVPSDIEVRHNHFFKPLSWKEVHRVKNHLESKSARRLLVTGNVMENCWGAGFGGDYQSQNGEAIILKSVGASHADEANCDWCVTEDVTISNNLIRHVGGVMDIVGRESAQVETNPELLPHTSRIKFENILAYDVGTPEWGTNGGYIYRVFAAANNLKFIHTTAEGTTFILQTEGTNNPYLTFRDNILEHQPYGINSGCGHEAVEALNCFSPYDFKQNVIVNNSDEPGISNPTQAVDDATLASWYQPQLSAYIAHDWNQVAFVDRANGNYRLSPSSPYRNLASDGKDIGVDQDALDLATSGVIAGTPASNLPVLAALSATSDPGLQVTLNWTASAGNLHHYRVERSQNGNSFTEISGNTTTTPTFTDATAQAGKSYLYRVCAEDAAGNCSLYSNTDIATTINFADPDLTGQLIKAQHLNELRQAVNAVRVLANLPLAIWTYPDPVSLPIEQRRTIYLDDITDLRTNLATALDRLGLAKPYATSPPLGQLMVVRKEHFQELRDRTK